MAHSFFITALENARREALQSHDAVRFLSRLESIHPAWHQTPFVARSLGFLSFHWYLGEEFKKAKGPQLWPGGIKPFTRADFKRVGWPYNVTLRAKNDDVASLAAFSLAIEKWHNQAHMAIGMDIRREDEMMNPALNIYLREFWRLHYFINARFLPELRKYDTSGTARTKIERLGTQHEPELGRI